MTIEEELYNFRLMITVVCALSWMGHILMGIGFIAHWNWIIYVGAIVFGYVMFRTGIFHHFSIEDTKKFGNEHQSRHAIAPVTIENSKITIKFAKIGRSARFSTIGLDTNYFGHILYWTKCIRHFILR